MKTVAAFVAMLISWPSAAGAEELPPTMAIFAPPSLEMGAPVAVVKAIARVESGLWPWTLNIEGKGFRFGSKKEALAKGTEALAAGRSFDVGLMQINSWWLRRYDISLEAALDPVANIYFGAWILRREIDRHGDIRAAVGAYHSPTPARASRYADQVMAALQGRPRNNSKPTVIPARPSPVRSRAAKAPSAAVPMVIASPEKVTVRVGSMKISATAPQNSMKVGSKR